MKKYEIILLTSQGQVKEIYTDNTQDENFEILKEFEQRMNKKYGDFIMLTSKEI